MDVNGTARIHFDDFEFDPRSGQLLRNGQPIRIQPQPLRVLKLLLERPGQTIPREELREHIWGGAAPTLPAEKLKPRELFIVAATTPMVPTYGFPAFMLNTRKLQNERTDRSEWCGARSVSFPN